MMDAAETKRQKAKQLRYRRPVVRDLNLESIYQELWDIQEQCEEVHWYFDTDDETLLNALDGDEDEAYEFKMMFADLCAECEKMLEDLREEWVRSASISYDSYEQDYFGLSCTEAFAEDESKRALKQLTKDNLIAAARQCFRIYQSFIALRHRYDCLKAAMDILRDENTGYLKMIKQIEEMYEKADEESDGFRYEWCKSVKELDRILGNMPQEAWIQ